MKVFNRIVCATDFTKACEHALEVSVTWSKVLGLPLRVLHAYDPSPMGPSGPVPFPAWPTAGAAQAIEKSAKDALHAVSESATLAGVEHDTEAISHPSASLAICDAVQADDLLVVGAHRHSHAHHLLLGSVAQQIIRHAPCAVLLDRGDAQPSPKRITVCTDFSDGATTALVLGGAVAAAFDAEATLIHARRESAWRRHLAWLDVDDHPEPEAVIKKSLTHLHEAHLPSPVKTEFILAHSIVDGILQHATANHIDILVLATHGRTGLSRLAIGSVAEQVARRAHCSVLIVRSADR
jgi:nucleotide-binding universal stress UspA family protein